MAPKKLLLTCAGCLQTIPDRTYLCCSICKENYDLDCANVSIQRFCNTMSVTNKNSWKCQKCYCNMPKKDNTNTPARAQQPNPSEEGKPAAVTVSNITLRKRAHNLQISTTYSDDDDISVLGDTQINSATISYQQFEILLDNKLETMKSSILTNIKNIMKIEISKAISDLKKDIQPTITTLTDTQNNHELQINCLNNYIDELRRKTSQIQTELIALTQQATNRKADYQVTGTKLDLYNNTNTQRKIVLYGLRSEPWENEQRLYERIIYIFRDVLNMDLEGHVDDIKRLGKKGPLLIEFLSKKTTQDILKSNYLFKNTGLNISSYMDENARSKRKMLITILIEARKNGQKANIIDNELYIDGKKQVLDQTTTASTNHKEMFSATDYSNKTCTFRE